MSATRPRVTLIVLGGTISGVRDQSGRHTPRLDASRLVRDVPGLDRLAEFVAPDLPRVGSHALTLDDLSALAHLVQAEIDDGRDGIVVTQGTDTLEETAYALALQVRTTVPVVLTGAMRTPTMPGADGPANLMAAVRVATTPKAAALGPVVVVQDEIHAAQWVVKISTSRAAAFASPLAGPVGEVVEGEVILRSRIAADAYVGLPDRLDRPVEIVWTYTGCDGTFVDAASQAAHGIVVAGMGGGHVPPAMLDALRRAVQRGLPVILSTRCVCGRVLTQTYSGAGTETDLIQAGLRSAGDLGPLKARLRLVVALACGIPPDEAFPAS